MKARNVNGICVAKRNERGQNDVTVSPAMNDKSGIQMDSALKENERRNTVDLVMVPPPQVTVHDEKLPHVPADDPAAKRIT